MRDSIPSWLDAQHDIAVNEFGTVPDAEVEQFVRDLIAVRRHQLIADCRRIAGVGA